MSLAQIHLKVTGIKNQKGKVMVALFNSEPHFPTLPYLREAIDILPDLTVEVQFKDLKEGFYAISVFHSKEGKIRPQLNILGMPTERYGFSNNQFGRFGKIPPFEQAKFKVTAITTLEIRLQSVLEAAQNVQ